MFDFLSKRFASIFNGFSKNKQFTQENLQETLQVIVDALLEADVPHALAQDFVAQVKEEVLGQKVLASLKPGEHFIKVVHDRLKAFLGSDQKGITIAGKARIMVVGLQGSGKTTSLVKLASWLRDQKKVKADRILLASIDYYRPAAIDQLEQLAKKAHIAFYRSEQQEPLAALHDIMAYADAHGYQQLMLDTAGRLHIDNQLLHELKEVASSFEPTHTLLVLDAMTGQESLQVARAFDQAVGFDYAMLSKMDSDTRGGAALSFRYALKKPIAFVGVGEQIKDFELFHPERMAGRILDMGDVVTLAEKADRTIKKEEQESLSKALLSGSFTLHDFAKQMDMMSKMGSMTSLVKYLPGMGGLNISAQDLQKGEQEMKVFRAIMSSMTPKELVRPALLDGSRKLRIAKGAGVKVEKVNLLLSRFEESKQYVKLLSKFGRGKRFF